MRPPFELVVLFEMDFERFLVVGGGGQGPGAVVEEDAVGEIALFWGEVVLAARKLGFRGVYCMYGAGIED